MKKLLYSLLTLAAALTVASCQKEPVNNADPSLGGPTVKATVSLNVSGLVDTKAFANAENVKKLHIAFYSGGELVESLSKVGTNAIDLTSKTYVYDLKLGKGVAYDIICWAESENSPYALDFTGKTVTYKENVSLSANNDTYDAFYGTGSLTAEDTAQKVNLTINLKRPFAQVNVLVPNDNVGAYKKFSSSMDVTVPTTMNLADGTLTGDAKKVSFAAAAIDEATIKENHTYVAMNYVFAPADAANYAVSFTVTPDVAADAATLDMSAVSLKRNRRTNLVGKIFDNEVDGSITVIILPDPDQGDEEVNTEAEDPDVTVALATGGEITEPLTIAQAGGTAEFTITTNSTGTVSIPETHADNDPSIATASVEAGEGTDHTNVYMVTVTGVADGTTYVIADLAAGQTKTELKASQIKVQVKVGDGVKKGVQSIAFSAETATAVIGAETVEVPDLDSSNAKGAISFASSNPATATVNAETGAVTLVAVGETEITATAAETTVDGLLYPAVTASYALTVNAAPVVTVETPTISPNGGEFDAAQEVTITCNTEGATIYYTLDNTAPSATNGTQYTAPFTVSVTTTIKAIAIKGEVSSDIATATFTISQSQSTLTKGEAWHYMFTEQVWTADGDKTLNGRDWNATAETEATDVYNFDSSNGRGQQFGTGSKKVAKETLTSNFGADYGIDKIVVNAAMASSGDAKLSVKVGETDMTCGTVTSVSLTTAATNYTFTSTELLAGDIVITLSQTSTKAMYVKAIYVNPGESVKLVMSDISCTEKTYNSLKFGWSAVDGAVGYQVSKDGENYDNIQTTTSFVWNGLEPTTEKTLYVKAIGDGVLFTDSDAKSATDETEAAPDNMTTYSLYSGELTEGDYLIVYNGNAMKNTINSNRLTYEVVTVVTNNGTSTISVDDGTAIEWHIAASGDYWTIYNADVKKFAAGNGTKNQAALVAETDEGRLWTVSGTTTYEFVNKKNAAVPVNSNLRNNGTNGFACYSNSTGGALSLYKKQ